jgi:outer membrane protein assembly factor BamA
MKRLRVLVCMLFVCVSNAQNASNNVQNDSTVKKLNINALPVLFYLPETGLGYGALGLATFRFKNEPLDSRPSSAQIGISLTTKNQLLIFAPYELYWKDEKWRLLGELGFYNFFYNFYGLGINSREEDFETYNVTFPRARISLLREVATNISIGLGYELDIYYDLKIQEGGTLDATEIAGKDEGGTISNVGIQLFYDSRDNIFFPSKGFFVQANAFVSSSFLASSFSYTKYNLDARYYKQLKEKHILAFNGFLGVNSDGAPLYDLNSLGTRRTRGFNDRRFQDFAELSFVSEYRFPISGRFSGAAFVSTGTLAPRLKNLFRSNYKNAGGIGLRYLLNKKEGIRIRVDYGLSSEGGNLYFTVREAF